MASAVRRMRVSLTMIVRDEEANLPTCLESVAELFDEIIVVDTGSTDRTPEIARSFGARVFDFVWVDDFAAARNAALAPATGDYIFWLDADDRIDEENCQRLRALLSGLRDEQTAFVMDVVSGSVDQSSLAMVVNQVRLFPNREDVRWTYRVHEQILHALQRAGIVIRWTNMVIHHIGYTDPHLRQRKTDRNVKILMAELEERPGDPFLLFNLARVAMDRKDAQTALNHLTASLNALPTADPLARNLHIHIAIAHQMLGDLAAALSACMAGLAAEPDDGELLFREAVVRNCMGDKEGAEVSWRRILKLGRPERFTCLASGIYGHLTRRNLAKLAEERGDRVEAFKLWSEVLNECPNDPQAIASRIRIARETVLNFPKTTLNKIIKLILMRFPLNYACAGNEIARSEKCTDNAMAYCQELGE